MYTNPRSPGLKGKKFNMLVASVESSGDGESSTKESHIDSGSCNTGRCLSTNCFSRVNRLTNSYDYVKVYTTMYTNSGWCS